MTIPVVSSFKVQTSQEVLAVICSHLEIVSLVSIFNFPFLLLSLLIFCNYSVDILIFYIIFL